MDATLRIAELSDRNQLRRPYAGALCPGGFRNGRPGWPRRRPGSARRCLRPELDVTTSLDQLAQLMKAAQGCCAFFAFALTVGRRGVAMEVRTPAEGLAMVEALFRASA